jgi:hypothetical protein
VRGFAAASEVESTRGTSDTKRGSTTLEFTVSGVSNRPLANGKSCHSLSVLDGEIGPGTPRKTTNLLECYIPFFPSNCGVSIGSIRQVHGEQTYPSNRGLQETGAFLFLPWALFRLVVPICPNRKKSDADNRTSRVTCLVCPTENQVFKIAQTPRCYWKYANCPAQFCSAIVMPAREMNARQTFAHMESSI